MTTHTYEPDHYFTTMGAHPLVLHIAPGDTVVTTTVDAAGQDPRMEQVAGLPAPSSVTTTPVYSSNQATPSYIDDRSPHPHIDSL